MDDPGAEPILSARGLTKRYGARVALDRVDLDVARGECLAIFGPNGAGKTTLTRILSTSLRASSGSVRIAGRDPGVEERSIRARIGLVSHQTFLYDDLTARENLLFFARLYGVPFRETRADELLEALGLLERADDKARALSRGLQQRLSLARALLQEPEIVFLDEPFTGLDPQAAMVLEETILRLRREARTLLLTTHDLKRGLALSDRFVILAKGRIAGRGISAEVDRPAFETFYLESLAAAARERARA